MKVGEGVGQGRKLPHPLPALSLTPFFARSLTLVPRSLLLKRTETLATQVKGTICPKISAKLLPKEAKALLPVDVRSRLKTPLLHLPSETN